jgi:hypothetical protein
VQAQQLGVQAQNIAAQCVELGGTRRARRLAAGAHGRGAQACEQQLARAEQH